MELEFKEAPPDFSVPFSDIHRLLQHWAVTCSAGPEAVRIYALIALLLTSEQSVLCLMANSAEQVGIMSGCPFLGDFFECRILPLPWVVTGCWLPSVTLWFLHLQCVPVPGVFQCWGCSPGVACLALQGLGLFEILVSCLLRIASCNAVQYSSTGSKIACWDH